MLVVLLAVVLPGAVGGHDLELVLAGRDLERALVLGDGVVGGLEALALGVGDGVGDLALGDRGHGAGGPDVADLAGDEAGVALLLPAGDVGPGERGAVVGLAGGLGGQGDLARVDRQLGGRGGRLGVVRVRALDVDGVLARVDLGQALEVVDVLAVLLEAVAVGRLAGRGRAGRGLRVGVLLAVVGVLVVVQADRELGVGLLDGELAVSDADLVVAGDVGRAGGDPHGVGLGDRAGVLAGLGALRGVRDVVLVALDQAVVSAHGDARKLDLGAGVGLLGCLAREGDLARVDRQLGGRGGRLGVVRVRALDVDGVLARVDLGQALEVVDVLAVLLEAVAVGRLAGRGRAGRGLRVGVLLAVVGVLVVVQADRELGVGLLDGQLAGHGGDLVVGGHVGRAGHDLDVVLGRDGAGVLAHVFALGRVGDVAGVAGDQAVAARGDARQLDLGARVGLRGGLAGEGHGALGDLERAILDDELYLREVVVGISEVLRL